MKKQLLLLGAVLSSLFSLAQVANGDFENWTVNYLYDAPTPWGTSVSESGGQLTNTTQSSDAQDLLSSVRLESVLAFGDTNFGFVLMGEMGDNGPENGTPYTGVGLPDSLIFWAKYDIQPTDSATALFATTYTGTPTSLNSFKMYGTQSTWVRKAYALGTIMAVDSVVIAFASSDALNEFAIPGSWLMVDNVQVKTTTGATWTPPNNSFETWDAVNKEDANDWYSSNLFYSSEDTTVLKTTDAYSNVYAAEVRTILNSYGDTLEGYLSNGPSVDGGWFTGVPYTAVPSTMDFYYKFLPSGVDSAWIQIDLMEGSNSIGGGYAIIKNAATSYTSLSVPVSQYSPGTVDTMRIIFNSGRNPGTSLFVDAVSLNGGTVSTEEITIENSLKHFPNPVVNELTVTFNASKSSNGSIEIFDINGRLVMSKNLNIISGANVQTINTEGLTQGVYTYVINNGGNVGVNKFIKK